MVQTNTTRGWPRNEAPLALSLLAENVSMGGSRNMSPFYEHTSFWGCQKSHGPVTRHTTRAHTDNMPQTWHAWRGGTQPEELCKKQVGGSPPPYPSPLPTVPYDWPRRAVGLPWTSALNRTSVGFSSRTLHKLSLKSYSWRLTTI